MFAVKRKAIEDGQSAHRELARYGLFEGRSRNVCLETMRETNPHPEGTILHGLWNQGWCESAGIKGVA